MTGAPLPEFHRPLAIDHIGPDGLDRSVEATQTECAALAERLGLPAVLALACRFRLMRLGAAQFRAEGALQARVVQTCVVSLEDFATAIEERFTLRFVPDGTERDEIDPEAEDELPYAGGGIDLGEAATEQLALALDPWPRRPDAALPAAATAAEAHPFAALARLKRPAEEH